MCTVKFQFIFLCARTITAGEKIGLNDVMLLWGLYVPTSELVHEEFFQHVIA